MTLDTVPLLRRGILALIAFGCFGLIGELVLLEHYEEKLQWTPLILLTLTLGTIVWHWVDGKARSLRTFQVMMILLILAGATGTILHLQGNIASEREFDPSLSGLPFWIEVLHGEDPLLAPGTLIQFGLLGLLYAYRHPALTSDNKA